MASYRSWPRRYRWPLELLLVALIITGVSLWLGRHMLATGQPLPNLPLNTLESGNRQNLQQLIEAADGEPVLVYAFAPWCSICKVSMPGLDMAIGDDARLISVSLDWQNTSTVADMVNSIDYQHPVWLGSQSVRDQLHVTGYPSYYLLDQQGLVRFADRGLTTPSGLWLRIQWLKLEQSLKAIF